MKKLLSILFLTAALNANAQFATDFVKAADGYFKKGDYYSAVQYYEKYLGISNKKTMSAAGFNPYAIQGKQSKGGGTAVMSTKEQAVYNIAECYRLLNYPAKAAPAYAEVIANSKDKFPLVAYSYGTTLRALQKYDEAKAQFNDFLSTYATQDASRTAAERELKNIEYIQSQLQRKDLNLYNIVKVGDNANGANYAAHYWGSNLIFTSTRKDTSNAKPVNDNYLYKAATMGGTLGQAEKLNIPQPEGLQQGAATVSADGKTIYFTQWEKKTENKNASIYYTTNKDGVWSAPVLVEGLNFPNASTQQPFVVNNTIYFASNRPGGVGGMDIYSGTINEGTATDITNLGFTINTPGDDATPSYWPVQNTLVFSSNGRVGMGGHDLYFAKKTETSFSEPQNFGNPVNSIKDDMYFATIAKGKNLFEGAVISSDRNAECCLELFAVNKTVNPKQIKGAVVSCDNKSPLANAKVNFVDASNNVVTTVVTDNNGQYKFELDEFKILDATATYEGLVDGKINMQLPMDTDADGLTNPDICLEKVFPPPPGEPIILNNIYFDYEKWDLLAESSGTLDDLVAKLQEHPEVKIEIGGHTDSNGEEDYNIKLSQKRAQACVNYLVSKGIAKDRLTAKGYGESQPIADNSNADGSDNPDGRAKNRRTEFKVIE